MNKYANFSKVDKSTMYKKIHKRGRVNCVKKRSFESKDSAILFLAQTNHEGAPYQCNHCHRWHNTTKNINKSR